MGSEVLKLVLIGNLKVWYSSVIEENKNEFEKKILINTVLETLRKLKIDNKLSKGDIDDNMDVDVSDEIKDKLKERIGGPLAELVIEQSDGKQIINGIFFGEVAI